MSVEEKQLSFPCPHGRTSWGHCPHCLGINSGYLGNVDCKHTVSFYSCKECNPQGYGTLTTTINGENGMSYTVIPVIQAYAWNAEWPKTPGWYWFYYSVIGGDPNIKILLPVEVRWDYFGKTLMYLAGGASSMMLPEQVEGVWQPIMMPILPSQ